MECDIELYHVVFAQNNPDRVCRRNMIDSAKIDSSSLEDAKHFFFVEKRWDTHISNKYEIVIDSKVYKLYNYEI